MRSRHDIVFVTSEIYPFSKTGGLGDVMGALPTALKRLGLDVAVVTPHYGRLSTRDYPFHLVYSNCHVGYPWPPITCDISVADYQGVAVYFIQRGEYFDRRYYYNTHTGDYFDNCERFIFFSRAALELCRRMDRAPSIVHCHDWQSALVPAYLHYQRRYEPYWHSTKSVQTIHNLAFQGRYASRLFFECGLPHEAWNPDGVEFWGDFNLLKSGVAFADMITTVSPAYAQEILSAQYGCGLEGILGKRRQFLRGILNGADYSIWDPKDDKFLPCTYCSDDLTGKKGCKKKLVKELGLDPALNDRPVLGFIGRLRGQKGIDLLFSIMPELMEMNVGLIILGEGNPEHENRISDLTAMYPGRVTGVVGYTEELAHRIQAGTDIFLMPSRYEPCGLTQIYSLRFGTPPVATAVGGLRDTIVPWPNPDCTGFTFPYASPESFLGAIRQAVDVWEDRPAWEAMQKRAMEADFSWDKAAKEYVALYRELGAKI